MRVGDITYVRMKARFIYLCLLIDVFTRVLRAWEISQHLNQSLTLKPLTEAFCHQHPGDTSFRSRRAVSFKSLYRNPPRTGRARFPSPVADALGRTDMLKDSYARSRKKKFTSTTIRTSTKPEFASVISSHKSIIRNAHIRR